ncbi:unnamed protein product [Spirodela intermedia]|uniref:Uncharacterized protein n=1 Tax=Spirodela intermedia TaxID=51605 RepID=A0A7I8JBJ0_SPIIN|nr:unnamed protein product [Spirodela intermedia]CAA6666832.1 unnamed protein product [Spirodela intermedia]
MSYQANPPPPPPPLSLSLSLSRSIYFSGFNDPFAGFGRFGTRGDLTPSFSGRCVPFGQPTKPFGEMLGPSNFDQRVFGSRGRPFGDPVDGGFFGENREITSDDEAEKEEEDDTQMKESATKRVRSDSLPSVQEPDGEIEDENTRRLQQKPGFLRAGSSLPQNSAFSFHSSTVTYGGLNGAYYTSSKTRRSGADGVVVEESREADATTGKATHRISRGIGNRVSLLGLSSHGEGVQGSIYLMNGRDSRLIIAYDRALRLDLGDQESSTHAI